MELTPPTTPASLRMRPYHAQRSGNPWYSERDRHYPPDGFRRRRRNVLPGELHGPVPTTYGGGEDGWRNFVNA